MSDPTKTLPTPDELCRWLEAHGWERDGEPTDRWISYRHPGLEASEIDVPRGYDRGGYKGHAVYAVELAAARLMWSDLAGFIRMVQPAGGRP